MIEQNQSIWSPVLLKIAYVVCTMYIYYKRPYVSNNIKFFKGYDNPYQVYCIQRFVSIVYVFNYNTKCEKMKVFECNTYHEIATAIPKTELVFVKCSIVFSWFFAHKLNVCLFYVYLFVFFSRYHIVKKSDSKKQKEWPTRMMKHFHHIVYKCLCMSVLYLLVVTPIECCVMTFAGAFSAVSTSYVYFSTLVTSVQ